jgi:hypothetical protein
MALPRVSLIPTMHLGHSNAGETTNILSLVGLKIYSFNAYMAFHVTLHIME